MIKKILLCLLLFTSFLFSQSLKSIEQEAIQNTNKYLKSNNIPMSIYKYKINVASKTYVYGYEIESNNFENTQNVINGTCTNATTIKALNDGWTYKYNYRNKFTKKITNSFNITKYTCN